MLTFLSLTKKIKNGSQDKSLSRKKKSRGNNLLFKYLGIFVHDKFHTLLEHKNCTLHHDQCSYNYNH